MKFFWLFTGRIQTELRCKHRKHLTRSTEPAPSLSFWIPVHMCYIEVSMCRYEDTPGILALCAPQPTGTGAECLRRCNCCRGSVARRHRLLLIHRKGRAQLSLTGAPAPLPADPARLWKTRRRRRRRDGSLATRAAAVGAAGFLPRARRGRRPRPLRSAAARPIETWTRKTAAAGEASCIITCC
jgi:hypothetical protein